MTKVTSLHEIVKLAEDTENVELIDVPVEGDAVTLLRVKDMPEYAFVMREADLTGTHSQIGFRMPYHGYSVHSVVCACCPSETYGLEAPRKSEEQLKLWKREKAVLYKLALVKTAQSAGVHTLFMRYAISWGERYGEVDGLWVVEADHFDRAIAQQYGGDSIRDAWRFIDWAHSRGVGESRR